MLKIDFKAASLVETLVAMVIVLITLATSLMIYLNVYSGTEASTNQHCFVLAENQLADVKKGREFLDEEITVDGYTVRQTFTSYNDYQELTLATIVVVAPGGEECSTIKEVLVSQ